MKIGSILGHPIFQSVREHHAGDVSCLAGSPGALGIDFRISECMKDGGPRRQECEKRYKGTKK